MGPAGRPARARRGGREDTRREQAAITAVALFGQVCLSTAALWLQWQSADAAVAGAFVSATAYFRIPLLLAGGLYGPTLADAARQYALGNRAGVLQRTAGALAAGVGGSTVIVGLLLLASPAALFVLYGADIGLASPVLVLLGVGTIATVAGNIVTQVLYGCQRAPSAALAWAPPALVTTVLYALSDGDVTRLAAAMAAGQVLAVVVLLALLPRALPASAPLRWHP